jgi:hypothetical protein
MRAASFNEPGSITAGSWTTRPTSRASATPTPRSTSIEDACGTVLDQIDSAYRSKYGRRYASIVDSINDAEHRATTLRLVPQEADR